jgi:hypothetical protein
MLVLGLLVSLLLLGTGVWYLWLNTQAAEKSPAILRRVPWTRTPTALRVSGVLAIVLAVVAAYEYLTVYR